jgi:hypothetical protein
MNELASKAQLRMSYFRWALVCITAILFCGIASAVISNSGYGNRWFAALVKPDLMPPGPVFRLVWPALYVLLGLSVASSSTRAALRARDWRSPCLPSSCCAISSGRRFSSRRTR